MWECAMYTDGLHITSLMCINVWCNKILSDETVIDTASCFSNFPRWPRPSAHALLLILTSLFWSWTLVIWLSPSWTVCSNVSHPTLWMYSCHLIEIALFLLWPLHHFKMFLDLRSKYTVFHNYPQYMLCYLKFAHRIHFFWLEIYHPFLVLFDWKPGFIDLVYFCLFLNGHYYHIIMVCCHCLLCLNLIFFSVMRSIHYQSFYLSLDCLICTCLILINYIQC